MITGTSLSDRLPADILLARAGLERLSTRRKRTCRMFAFKLTDGSVPEHLTAAFDHFVPETPERRVQLWSSNSQIPHLPHPHSELLHHSPFYLSLLKSIPSVDIKFYSSLKEYLTSLNVNFALNFVLLTSPTFVLLHHPLH